MRGFGNGWRIGAGASPVPRLTRVRKRIAKGKGKGSRDRRGRFAPPGSGVASGGSSGGAKPEARPGMGDIAVPEFGPTDSAYPHIDPSTGGFTKERQALHDRMVEERLAGLTPNPSGVKTFVLLGGGPAAGKSTLLEGGLLSDMGAQAVTVNSDDIKEEIPEAKKMIMDGDGQWAAHVHEESSYLAKRIEKAAMERNLDLVLDGTGNGNIARAKSRVEAAHAAGYRLNAHYVTVPTEVAVERARIRGEQTGRVVPETVIRATHASVSKTAPVIAAMADDFTLHDTSGSEIRLVARQRRGAQLEVFDADGWDAFLGKANEEFAVTDSQPDVDVEALGRMVTEAAQGVAKADSRVDLTDPAVAGLWDRINAEVTELLAGGAVVEPPVEWPDTPDDLTVVD